MIEAIRAVVLAPRPSAAERSPGLNRMQIAVEHSIESLTLLRDQLADLTTLQQAAAALAASKPMAVCGFRGSVPLASWFSFFASKIHPGVMALWGSDSHMVEKIAQARMRGATALLAIVMPRYPAQALLTVQAAKKEGLQVILLVDSTLSPLTPYADMVLQAQVNPTSSSTRRSLRCRSQPRCWSCSPTRTGRAPSSAWTGSRSWPPSTSSS